MPKVLHDPALARALDLADGTFFEGDEPCPRCGGRKLWPEVSLEDEPYGIYCAGCDWVGPRASTPDGDPHAAMAAWNDEARKVRLARELGLTVNLVQPREDAHG